MIQMTLRRFVVGMLLLIAAFVVPWLMITSQKPKPYATDVSGNPIKDPRYMSGIEPE